MKRHLEKRWDKIKDKWQKVVPQEEATDNSEDEGYGRSQDESYESSDNDIEHKGKHSDKYQQPYKNGGRTFNDKTDYR